EHKRGERPCLPPARCTWSGTYSRMLVSWACLPCALWVRPLGRTAIWDPPASVLSRPRTWRGGEAYERRGAIRTHDDRRGRPDRGARDPRVLRRRLRVWAAVPVILGSSCRSTL